MRKLTQGTIEYLVLDIEDQLETIDTLDGTSPTYTVVEAATETIKINAAPANNDGMTLYGLLDSSILTNWPVGLYKLYAGFTIGPETPRIGPFKFRIDA